jgi:hypothetical protein
MAMYPERVEEKVYFTIDIKLLRALLYLTLTSGLVDEKNRLDEKMRKKEKRNVA